jgi:hypothetical protein
MNVEKTFDQAREKPKIDWKDVTFVAFLGISFVLMKIFEFLSGNNEIGEMLIGLACIICIVYILMRASHQPEKLREWGFITPITRVAFVFFIGFLLVSLLILGFCGWALFGMLPFEIHYVAQMIDYTRDAFLQQFLIFAIGVVNLEKFPLLRGKWRLPILMGILFAFVHPIDIQFLWGIPLPLLLLFPMGFLATYYFQRFRTILPNIAIHAIGYVLLSNWITSLL